MASQLNLVLRPISTGAPQLKLKTISNTLVVGETFHADITLEIADRIFDHKVFILSDIEVDVIIIGNEFLRRHNIWINPKNAQVCFEEPADKTYPSSNRADTANT